MTGWSIVLYNGNGGASYNTIALTGVIPSLCDGRGVSSSIIRQDGIQNGDPDGLALVKPGSVVVEFLSYEGTFTAVGGPASGMTSVDIGARESGTSSATRSLQKAGTIWYGPASNTFGACNPAAAAAAGTVSFSGRNFSDPALPVGFQDQLFATVARCEWKSGRRLTITWSSDTPAIASIDQDGVFTALAAGTAILRATGANGTTGTWTLPTRVAVASTTAIYAGNAEFGEPTDADPSDDFIVRHPEYTTSFNKNRGTPNWVSYDLEPTHFGPEDRCDCFTFDPALPGVVHALHDRRLHRRRRVPRLWHRSRSPRALVRPHVGKPRQRIHFLFTNIVPQAADLNQGPWAIMENFLGDLARTAEQGGLHHRGRRRQQGDHQEPGQDRDSGEHLESRGHHAARSGPRQRSRPIRTQVIAVIMPNEPGVRNVDWHTYKTTVDAVEALSGYDLLASAARPDRDRGREQHGAARQQRSMGRSASCRRSRSR